MVSPNSCIHLLVHHIFGFLLLVSIPFLVYRMPPRKSISRRGKRLRDRSPTPSPSSSEGSDSEWSGEGDAGTGPQVTQVPRGSTLPPRRSTQAGEGSTRQPRALSPPPEGVVGPLVLHRPSCDPHRVPHDWHQKSEVVAPQRNEDPRPLRCSATDNRFWTLFSKISMKPLSFP